MAVTGIWAHRGNSAAEPENTIAAFESAIAAGADGIELDVQLTSDGVAVIHHDDAMTLPDGARVPLRSLDRETVATLDVGADGAVHRVPTLPEVLELLAPTGLALNIEIKGSRYASPAIVETVVRASRHSGMADRVVYSTFEHSTLAAVRDLDPGAEIAPLYEDALVRPWAYVAALGAAAAHPYVRTLDEPGILEGFTRAGIAVRPWTVNDWSDLERLMRSGVDAVMTDDPAAAVALRAAL